MLGVYSHFESMQMGLETFFQDADKGRQKFEELRKLSNETTFGVDELTNSFTQLANVGVNVDTINDKLVMLGNIANGDKNKFADLVSVYSKIMSTGKAGSMQLQQLAMRGVPIYDMLKKIGVQGTATGEDITKAFQEMTKEGGQFYNAMNNINKTIEGKEGFISDYFREMSVNLMEVTGIADAYKNILDWLKEAIGAVSDKLLEWNNNPVAKAIIQGAVITTLTMIGTVIVSTIIPALVSVIAKLQIIAALKATINPGTLIAGLGVAVVAGLAVGISSLAKSQKELADNTKDATDRLKEQYVQETLLDKLNKAREMRDFYKQKMEEERKGLDELYKQRKETISKLEEERKSYDKAIEYWGSVSEVPIIGAIDDDLMKAYGFTAKVPLSTNNKSVIKQLEEQVSDFDKQIESSKKTVESYFNMMNTEAEKVGTLSVWEENKKTVESLRQEFEAISGTVNTTDKQILDLEKTLKKLKDYKALEGTKMLDEKGNLTLVKFDDSEKKEIDKTIEYFQNKLDTLRLSLTTDNSWRTAFENITGVKLGQNEKGISGGRKVRDKAYEELEKLLEINNLTHGGKAGEISVYESIASGLKDKIESLMLAEGVDDPFKSTDASIKMLSDTLLVFQGKSAELRRELEKTGEETEKLAFNLGKSLGEKLESVMTGTDVGSFVSDMKNGADWKEALLDVVVGDLLEFAGGFEKVQYILNIIKNILQALSPLLEAILNVVSILSVILKPILDALNTFLKKLFKNWNDWFDEQYRKNEEQKEVQSDLTKSYEALLKAIKEQEEYYIKKKAELNMLALDDKVTKVNDMILSPHGAFSTNPNDTIIATKNPQGLGGVTNNIKVINNAGVNVDVRENKGNGLNEIIVNISRKIASDVAEGLNGWDGAMALQQQRISGRRI